MSQNGPFFENTDQGYDKNWKHWPGLWKKNKNTDQGYEK